MKYVYVVVTVVNKGKLYAFDDKLNNYSNLLGQIEKIMGLSDNPSDYRNNITIMDSKKQAMETAKAWNEAYKKNGTFGY